MDSVARIIVDNAQTVYDGGVIGDILENVKLLNNTELKKDIMPYFTNARISGGYIAGLIFGLLWIITFLMVMIYLIYSYLKQQKRSPKKSNQTNRRLSFQSSKAINIFLTVFIAGMLLFSLFLICFYIGNIAHLRNSMKDNPKDFQVNKTKPVSLIPALKNSLFHIKHFLKNFPDNSRRDTKEVVDDIINATIEMQKETQKHFNSILMRTIGVTATFEYGEQMSGVVLNFFDISNQTLILEQNYKNIIQQLNPTTSDPKFSFFQFLKEIRSEFKNIDNCKDNCLICKNFFTQKFEIVNSFPETKFASSFRYVMEKENQTREKVIDQGQEGKRKLADQMKKTNVLMKKHMDIPGTIRNMTDLTWDKMEVQMEGVIEKIDAMELKLDSDETQAKANKYSLLLAFLLIFPLFLIFFVLISVILIVGRFYSPESFVKLQEKHTNYLLYLSFGLLAAVLLFSMILFLYGGKFETELCRYIRTKQVVLTNKNGSSFLALDGQLNKFLEETIPKLEAAMKKKPDFPMMKPNNLMYGLIYRCKNNEPILEAIDAIRTLDTKALSKPELSNHFVNIGRGLMKQSLMENDPNKMMPKNMKKTLEQVTRLNMFKSVDVSEELKKLPESPIALGDGTPLKIEVLLTKFRGCLRVLKFYLNQNNNPQKQAIIERLEKQLSEFKELINRFITVTSRVKLVYEKLTKVPDIVPIVKNLNDSLVSMVALMTNKTQLLSIAESKFNEIIASTTPQKAAKIMAKFGPKMMSTLGHCRPIYNAYSSVIDTTCDVTVAILNACWVYLGTLVLLLSSLLVVLVSWTMRHRGKAIQTHDNNLDDNGKPDNNGLKMNETNTLIAQKYTSGDLSNNNNDEDLAKSTNPQENPQDDNKQPLQNNNVENV